MSESEDFQSELEDFKLDKPEDFELDKPSDEPPPPGAPESRWKVWWLDIAASLLVGVIGGYIVLRQSERREPPAPARNARRPASIDCRGSWGSTSFHRSMTPSAGARLVRRLSSHPRVVAWLATDGLLLSFAVVIEIATGTPRRGVAAPRLAAQFRTRVTKAFCISTYRATSATTVMRTPLSLDPRGTARLYATLTPRINVHTAASESPTAISARCWSGRSWSFWRCRSLKARFS